MGYASKISQNEIRSNYYCNVSESDTGLCYSYSFRSEYASFLTTDFMSCLNSFEFV